MAGPSWDTSRYLTLFSGEATEHLEALAKDDPALSEFFDGGDA